MLVHFDSISMILYRVQKSTDNLWQTLLKSRYHLQSNFSSSSFVNDGRLFDIVYFNQKYQKLSYNNHKFYLSSSNNAKQVIGCNQGSSPGRDRDPGQFWILGQYRDSGYAKSFILRIISLFSKKRPSHKINEISLKKMGSRFSKVDPGPVTILYGDCQVSRHAKIFSTSVEF